MIKQTDSQLLGKKGERWFASIIPPTWDSEKPAYDIGIDFKVTLGSEKRVGGFEFAVQVKSSKKWSVLNDCITIRDIKIDSILLWGTRLYPTLFVLYDDSLKSGYFGWVFDILNQPIESIIRSDKKTVTLKLPSKSILNSEVFPLIEDHVTSYYTNLVSSLASLRKTANVLPFVNRFIEALRAITKAYHLKPNTEEQIMMISLLAYTGHRDFILSLRDLQSKFQIDVGSGSFFDDFEKIYLNKVDKIILDFSSNLESSETVVTYMNSEKYSSETPVLIDMLIDLIYRLTNEESKEKNT